MSGWRSSQRFATALLLIGAPLFLIGLFGGNIGDFIIDLSSGFDLGVQIGKTVGSLTFIALIIGGLFIIAAFVVWACISQSSCRSSVRIKHGKTFIKEMMN